MRPIFKLKYGFFSVMLLLTGTVSAITGDSLIIEPPSPLENDMVMIRSYLTVANCCTNYDSILIKTNLVEYFWYQTQCSDPWHTGMGQSYEETRDSLSAYLLQSGIGLQHLTIVFDPEIAEECAACPCLSGNILYIYVSTADSTTMNTLDFFKGSAVLNEFIKASHTEVIPGCDCFCRCTDTVWTSDLEAGEHRLIFSTAFYHPDNYALLFESLDTLNFSVYEYTSLLPGNQEGEALLLYPNPAQGYIVVPEIWTGCEYKILDQSGRIVMQGQLDRNILYMEKNPEGIFWLQIMRNGKLAGSRLILIQPTGK
jgi:hypothetical protein